MRPLATPQPGSEGEAGAPAAEQPAAEPALALVGTAQPERAGARAGEAVSLAA
jgi:hypothetical protein